MIDTANVPACAASPATGRGLRAPEVALLAAAVVAAVFAHREALTAMVRLWDVSPMYSYGYTVPFISAYLLWRQGESLARVQRKPSRLLGGALALLALTLAAAARLGAIQVLDQLAFLVSLTAAVVLLLGRRFAVAAWAPIAYLLLMIPIWDGFTERLHEPFQLRSATIGVAMLQTIGVPAFRDGTIIVLPNVTLEVARACSGVNYLVAVLALGLPLSYLYLPGIWRRTALLVTALAVAAFSNGLRVALIGLLAYREVGSALHGPFHVLHGLFVAGIGYVVLFAGLRILTPHGGAPAAPRTQANESARLPAGMSTRVPVGAALAFVTVFILAGLSPVGRVAVPVPLEGRLEEFPRVLGAWESVHDAMLPSTSADAWPGADVELRRRYRRTTGVTADLYIGYFEEQRQGQEIISHLATELHNRAVRVELSSPSEMPFAANRSGDGGTEVVVFWYELEAGSEVNRFGVKLKTLWSTVRYGRSHGAVVALSTLERRASAEQDLLELAPLVRAEIASRMRGKVRPAS